MRPRKIVAIVIIVLFSIIWIFSIASCAVVDWTAVTTRVFYPYNPITVKIGLWSACSSGTCVSGSNLNYSSNCNSLLQATAAFSILTILFAFFTSLAYSFTLWNHRFIRFWEITGLVLAIITLVFSILPWTIFLGFTGSSNNCASNGSLGSGWALALVSWILAIPGTVLAIGHCCCCRRSDGETRDPSRRRAPDAGDCVCIPAICMAGGLPPATMGGMQPMASAMKPDPLAGYPMPCPVWAPSEYATAPAAAFAGMGGGGGLPPCVPPSTPMGGATPAIFA